MVESPGNKREFFSLFSGQQSTQRQKSAQTGNKHSETTTSNTSSLVQSLCCALDESKGCNYGSVHSLSSQFQEQIRLIWNKLQKVTEIGLPILSFELPAKDHTLAAGSRALCLWSNLQCHGLIPCTPELLAEIPPGHRRNHCSQESLTWTCAGEEAPGLSPGSSKEETQ